MKWYSLVVGWRKRKKQGRSLVWVFLLTTLFIPFLFSNQVPSILGTISEISPSDDVEIWDAVAPAQWSRVYTKFDISILSGYEGNLSAKYIVKEYSFDTYDANITRGLSQTWTEGDSKEDIWAIGQDLAEEQNFADEGDSWWSLNVTAQLAQAISDGYENFTIILEDPDWQMSEVNGKNSASAQQIYIGNSTGSPPDKKGWYSRDSPGTTNDPYLEVDTTTGGLYPVCGEILGEPSYMLPNITYTVYSAATDPDGGNDIDYMELSMSSDHSTYMVTFRWDEDTNTFTQQAGLSYAWLNISASTRATITDGYNVTWVYIPLVGWRENCIDFGNYVRDGEGNSDGPDWNDHNSWYTNRLSIRNATVYWEDILPSVDQWTENIWVDDILQNEDWIDWGESLDTKGYVTWHNTSIIYNGTFGFPNAELVVNGTNVGGTYYDTLDANGYFDIQNYITPDFLDYDWNVTVVLADLPTNITEGPAYEFPGVHDLWLSSEAYFEEQTIQVAGLSSDMEISVDGATATAGAWTGDTESLQYSIGGTGKHPVFCFEVDGLEDAYEIVDAKLFLYVWDERTWDADDEALFRVFSNTTHVGIEHNDNQFIDDDWDSYQDITDHYVANEFVSTTHTVVGTFDTVYGKWIDLPPAMLSQWLGLTDPYGQGYVTFWLNGTANTDDGHYTDFSMSENYLNMQPKLKLQYLTHNTSSDYVSSSLSLGAATTDEGTESGVWEGQTGMSYNYMPEQLESATPFNITVTDTGTDHATPGIAPSNNPFFYDPYSGFWFVFYLTGDPPLVRYRYSKDGISWKYWGSTSDPFRYGGQNYPDGHSSIQLTTYDSGSRTSFYISARNGTYNWIIREGYAENANAKFNPTLKFFSVTIAPTELWNESSYAGAVTIKLDHNGYLWTSRTLDNATHRNFIVKASQTAYPPVRPPGSPLTWGQETIIGESNAVGTTWHTSPAPYSPNGMLYFGIRNHLGSVKTWVGAATWNGGTGAPTDEGESWYWSVPNPFKVAQGVVDNGIYHGSYANGFSNPPRRTFYHITFNISSFSWGSRYNVYGTGGGEGGDDSDNPPAMLLDNSTTPHRLYAVYERSEGVIELKTTPLDSIEWSRAFIIQDDDEQWNSIGAKGLFIHAGADYVPSFQIWAVGYNLTQVGAVYQYYSVRQWQISLEHKVGNMSLCAIANVSAYSYLRYDISSFGATWDTFGEIDYWLYWGVEETTSHYGSANFKIGVMTQDGARAASYTHVYSDYVYGTDQSWKGPYRREKTTFVSDLNDADMLYYLAIWMQNASGLADSRLYFDGFTISTNGGDLYPEYWQNITVYTGVSRGNRTSPFYFDEGTENQASEYSGPGLYDSTYNDLVGDYSLEKHFTPADGGEGNYRSLPQTFIWGDFQKVEFYIYTENVTDQYIRFYFWNTSNYNAQYLLDSFGSELTPGRWSRVVALKSDFSTMFPENSVIDEMEWYFGAQDYGPMRRTFIDGFNIHLGDSDIQNITVILSKHGNTTESYGFYFNEDINEFGEMYGSVNGSLDTGTCSYTKGSPTWKDTTVTFNFTLNWTWVEGGWDWVDIGVRVGFNSTNIGAGCENSSWYVLQDANIRFTKQIQLHDLTVRGYWDYIWQTIVDGTWVKTNSSMRIFGYYYMVNSTTPPSLDSGTPRVRLIIDGVDLGDTYFDDISLTGYFLIDTYTSPLTQDPVWSVNITLTNIPTGGIEGMPLDDGRFELMLYNFPPPYSISPFGIVVLLMVQPDLLVPARTTEITLIDLVHAFGWSSAVQENDTIFSDVDWGAGTETYDFMFWEWDVAYPLAMTECQYDIYITNPPAFMKFFLRARNATNYEVFSTTTTATGSYAIGEDFWDQGRVVGYIQIDEDATEAYNVQFDQMAIAFDSITEEQQTERVVNGTQVNDILTFEVLQYDVNITVSDITTTYNLVNIAPSDAYVGYIDTISSNGILKLIGCSKGTFEITFDTTKTYHEVSFRAALPDGLEEQWDTFAWYINGSRVANNPYPMSHGVWEITVKDYFEQTIYSQNVTILTTDQREFTIEFILPVYMVGIKNEDRESYYLNITRNEITSQQPLPPLGEVHFRVYGVVPSANYTVQVLKSADDTLVGQFTLSVPDHAISEIVDYVQEEEVDFVTVFPSSIEVDQNLTISGWVFWTNGTAITSFNAYANWGTGDEALTTSGTNFYGSHVYNTIGTKQFNVTIEVAGQANETRNYLVNVEESRFSDAPLMAIDFLPAQAEVNEPMVVFGAIHYATGEPAQGDVTIYWGDYAFENVTLSLGTLQATHTYGSPGTYLIAIKFPLSGTDYWYNATYTIIPNPMGTQGNLQFFTDSTGTIHVYTINQLSGDLIGYQVTDGSPVNLNLDSSNFDLLDQLETSGDITFQDSWEDGDYISDPTWTAWGAGGTVVSESPYGDYSLKADDIDGGGSSGVVITTADFVNTNYLIVVVKVVGIYTGSDRAYICISNNSNYIVYDFQTSGYHIASAETYVHHNMQIKEGEWYVFCFNWREDFYAYFGAYPADVQVLYVAEYDNSASRYALFDLIAFTGDPSMLFASEYALHAFAQGEGDHALDTLGDAWDFQEDEDGFSSTDTGYGGKIRYQSDGCLVTESIGATSTYVNIAMIGTIVGTGAISIDADKYKWVQVRLKTNHTNTFWFQIWTYDGTGWDATIWHDIRYSGVADQWQLFTWEISQDSDWTGIITGLQFRADNDPDNMPADVMFWVDYIMFTTSDPRDFTKYQTTTVDLLDGGQHVTVFPTGTLLIDSGLTGDTRAIVTNALGDSVEYTVEDSALSLDLTYNSFESYTTTFDDPSEIFDWVFSDSSNFDITDGYLSYDGTGSGWEKAYYKGIEIEDGEITVTLSYDDVASEMVAIIFRGQDIENYYHADLATGTDCRFYKHVDNTYTLLSSVTGLSFSPNEVIEFTVRYYDNFFEFYLDGTLVLYHSDSTFLSSGFVGVSPYIDCSAKFFDFTTTSLPDSRDYTILGLEVGEKEFFYDERGDLVDYIEIGLEGHQNPQKVFDWYFNTNYLIMAHNATAGSDTVIKWTNLGIDASVYQYSVVRYQILNETDSFAFDIRDSDFNIVGDSFQVYNDEVWHADLNNYSDDSNWVGTEQDYYLYFEWLADNAYIFLDYSFLLSDSDYEYQSVQLDQPRVVVLFPGFTTIAQLSAVIPNTGVKDASYTVYGSVFWSNGTAVDGTVTVYWGAGEGSTGVGLSNGLFAISHTYTSSGTYAVAVNYASQWINSTVFIESPYADQLVIETYWFDDDDVTYIFITLTTNQGDCSVNVTENGTPKLTAQSESTRLVYAKATIPGYYNVTVQVYKSGYTTVTIFSSYTVLAETFYVRDFEYGVNDEFFFLLIDTNWDNATVDVWIIAVSPNGTITKVLEGISENTLLQWSITNDERQARYVYVYAKVSGSLTQYEWRNFTYSYRIPIKEALSNIQFPAYRQEFDVLRSSLVGMNQLMLIGFVGLVLAMVFQSRAWGKEFFERPMVQTNKKRRRREK